MDNSPNTKPSLRKTAQQLRSTLSVQQCEHTGKLLIPFLSNAVRSLSPHATIAAYVSMGTEISTIPLLNSLLYQGFRVITPKLGRGLDIGWGEISRTEELIPMPRLQSGAQRPDETQEPTLSAESLLDAELIIVPAFAIDLEGNRLGRGAGWYDRALEYRNPYAAVIAVCWPWEYTETILPHESHDVTVNAVLTGERLILLP